MPNKTLKILVVDDNPADIDLLSDALLQVAPAAEIDSSTSAHLALGLLQAACARGSGPVPNLVVLDMRMPLISGPDLLRGLQAQPDLAGMRIVMLSGQVEESDRERCRQLGVMEIWKKPTDYAGYLGLARQLVDLVP
jgi:CheY-like chemotaxis protein